MNTKLNKTKILYFIFYICIFAFVFIWFNNVHQMIIFDGDDWTYSSYSRNLWPSTSMWNPARVFPEIFMRLPASVGVYLLYPVTGDYIGSISTGFAFTLAVFITAYMVMFGKFLRERFQLSGVKTVISTVLFLLFHFSVFKSASSDNYYMFWSQNPTCVFYYLVSSLLNCIVLLYVAGRGIVNIVKEQGHYLKKGILVVMVYLAIFSNMYPSIILAVYIGADLLVRFILQIAQKEKFTLKKALVDYGASVVIICAWLTSLLFELFGGRADSLGENSYFVESAKELFNWSRSLNVLTVVIISVSVICALGIYLYNRKKGNKEVYSFILAVLAISMVVASLYLVIVASSTGYWYLKRADVIYSVPFFALLIGAISFAYVIKNVKWSEIVTPILLLLLICNTFNGTHIFRENIRNNMSAEKTKELDYYIMEQVIEAVNAGETSMELKVPYYTSEDNYPIPYYFGDRITTTLMRHGLIDRYIEITIVPDESVNEEFGL